MLILIDVDGVVADTLQLWADKYGWDKNKVTAYNVNKVTGDPKAQDIFRQPNFFKQVFPIPGAIAGIRELREAGHELIFVTSTPDGCYQTYGDKVDWLKSLFPWIIEHKHIIFSQSRHALYGDILIDDRLENLSNFLGHAILLDAPYNQGDTSYSTFRAKNWDEIIKCVERIEHLIEDDQDSNA